MIVDFETRILALIDNMVEHASDDELFAGGYLRGHLTLAVAQAQENDEHTPEELHERVQSCLAEAIGNGELSPPDQILVFGMWQTLYAQAGAE
ncbi:YfcL family protein [Acerihabitans sp. TG2]|uniref:YfcL family protein n=1 Tax=Acerihabitans sp. TG2 TaxID=3096008 RepID=UPI002B23373B|nr:YfcL family protein [Acerihabitans sp. TG2]MEA9389114.1 YfcL family protein [Acerihabitans sp. TG2]